PKLAPMDVPEWICRNAILETRLKVSVVKGPALQIAADADQLDQMLINLIRNAADASLETGGQVEVGWSTQNEHLDVEIHDNGPGIYNSANLFVPLFTTKPGGSGIGLVLCRQIAEGHGGELTLKNRIDATGCEARLRFPLPV